MNTQQAYINGFMKRASEYGYNENEAIYILKLSTAADAPQPGFLDKLQGLGTRAAGALNSAGQGIQNIVGGVKAFGEGYDKLRSSWDTATGKTPAAPAPAAPAPAALAPAAQPAAKPSLSLGGSNNVSLTPLPAPSTQALKPATLSLGGSNDVSLGTPQFQQPTSGPSTGLGVMQPSPTSSPTLQSAAPAPAAVSAASSGGNNAGPSDAQLAKIMGSYDPKSRLDQAKAQRIREMYSQGITSPKEIYADKGYSGITPQSIRRAPQQAANNPQMARPNPQMARPSLQGGPAGVNPNAFSGTQRLNYR